MGAFIFKPCRSDQFKTVFDGNNAAISNDMFSFLFFMLLKLIEVSLYKA